MTTMQLRFRSSLFNSSQPRANWPAKNAYGEDLAEWLRAQLQCDGYALSTPRWQAEAWTLECRRGEETHAIRVRGDGIERWTIEIARTRSWIASLVLPEPATNPSLAEAIHSSLLREPAVQDLEWKRPRAPERAMSIG